MSKAIASKTHEDFVLPIGVVSRTDLSRLVMEFERVDNELTDATARAKSGSKKRLDVQAMSANLNDFIESNGLLIKTARERTRILKELRILKQKAPIIHMTFATVADPQSLERICGWLRSNIHPQVVVGVGLQPDLIAGVYLRTPNHVHDLSLRDKLKDKRGLLVNELKAVHHG
jgi:hypothetical protein